MAKPKSPLLSLGAHGTIGDALTFQKRGRQTIVREKPTPKDPYSLPQAYQRWLYKDYAYLWTLQTNSQKQVYRTRASRYHITGFSLWMREHLRDLPDIVAMWHLDEKAGAIAYDSGPNHLNGTIFGATPIKGIIDYALDFDGINNRVDFSDPALLRPGSNSFTWEAFIKTRNAGVGQWIMGRYTGWANAGHYLYWDATNAIVFRIHDSVNAPIIFLAGTLADTLYHIVAARDAGNFLHLVINGAPVTPVADTAGNIDVAQNFWIGAKSTGTEWFDGLIDHVPFYNRVLDDTEAKRHSLRRYPA